MTKVMTNQTLEQRITNELDEFNWLENNSKILFKKRAYFELLSLIDTRLYCKKYGDPITHILCLNEKFVYLIYKGLAYIELSEYSEAIDVLLLIEQDYEILLSLKRQFKKKKRKPFKQDNKLLNDTLIVINNQISNVQENLGKTFSNLAFAYYKLKDYENSIKYYKKAIFRDKKNPQLHLELSQAQYRNIKNKNKSVKWYNLIGKIQLKKDIIIQKINYQKTIELYKTQETNFETLLSIGKLLYFLGDYHCSLNYVQNAIELCNTKETKHKKIFAYDWLSRIAYKEKKYSVAVSFYEKIIDNIISNSNSISENGIIHQKPKLNDMVKYLNEVKDLVAKREVHYFNKSIWGGIITGIILESAEIYTATESMNIPICMIVILLIAGFIYINIYK